MVFSWGIRQCAINIQLTVIHSFAKLVWQRPWVENSRPWSNRGCRRRPRSRRESVWWIIEAGFGVWAAAICHLDFQGTAAPWFGEMVKKIQFLGRSVGLFGRGTLKTFLLPGRGSLLCWLEGWVPFGMLGTKICKDDVSSSEQSNYHHCFAFCWYNCGDSDAWCSDQANFDIAVLYGPTRCC